VRNLEPGEAIAARLPEAAQFDAGQVQSFWARSFPQQLLERWINENSQGDLPRLIRLSLDELKSVTAGT
jgi:hypothetical protein